VAAPAEVFRIGVVQMRSTDDPWENLLLVEAFVEEAVARGCELVAFPEAVFYRGPRGNPARDESRLALDATGRVSAGYSDFARALADAAARWPLPVVLGSVLESRAGFDKPFNSQWILQGEQPVQSYSKIHLFEYEGTRASYSESRDCEPGLTAFACHVGTWRIMSSICYDLRFPELYRHVSALAPSDLILVPAAFTAETGRAHWHALLRARAIENLAFVAAPAQWGDHRNAEGRILECYGHALVYGPWGELLAEAPEEGDALLTVDLPHASIRVARDRLPGALRPKVSLRMPG
jgi:predicted amidohydrolase